MANEWLVQHRKNVEVLNKFIKQRPATPTIVFFDTEQQAFVSDNTVAAVHNVTRRNKPDEYERMDFLRGPDEFFERAATFLGSGAYGAARKTDSGFVVKKFRMKDAYGMWLAFCMMAYQRGSGNAQLPKVFAMSIPAVVDDDSQGYALMECLSKYDDDDTQERETTTYAFRDGLHTLNNNVQYGNPIAGTTKSQFEKLFAEFLVLANRDGMRIGIDAHMGNLLYRNYGTDKEVAVVTDPVVLSEGSVRDAKRFMEKMLKIVSMYTPALWSEMRVRQVYEATVQ